MQRVEWRSSPLHRCTGWSSPGESDDEALLLPEFLLSPLEGGLPAWFPVDCVAPALVVVGVESQISKDSAVPPAYPAKMTRLVPKSEQTAEDWPEASIRYPSRPTSAKRTLLVGILSVGGQEGGFDPARIPEEVNRRPQRPRTGTPMFDLLHIPLLVRRTWVLASNHNTNTLVTHELLSIAYGRLWRRIHRKHGQQYALRFTPYSCPLILSPTAGYGLEQSGERRGYNPLGDDRRRENKYRDEDRRDYQQNRHWQGYYNIGGDRGAMEYGGNTGYGYTRAGPSYDCSPAGGYDNLRGNASRASGNRQYENDYGLGGDMDRAYANGGLDSPTPDSRQRAGGSGLGQGSDPATRTHDEYGNPVGHFRDPRDPRFDNQEQPRQIERHHSGLGKQSGKKEGIFEKAMHVFKLLRFCLLRLLDIGLGPDAEQSMATDSYSKCLICSATSSYSPYTVDPTLVLLQLLLPPLATTMSLSRRLPSTTTFTRFRFRQGALSFMPGHFRERIHGSRSADKAEQACQDSEEGQGLKEQQKGQSECYDYDDDYDYCGPCGHSDDPPPRSSPGGHNARVTAQGREYSFGGKNGNGSLDMKHGPRYGGRLGSPRGDNGKGEKGKGVEGMREQYDT
ncbi:hypothetical protein NMY22_g3695 [Coprinellus aureogranulatus]|nr:hypothetical protein NMY22_g3695 [Coprinellus aureogranulatus]